MVYSNSHIALDIGAWVYNRLGITGPVMIDVRPLDADGYCTDNALIEINRHLSPEKTAIAICHELIHWKQYQDTGEFDEEDAYSREEELCQEYINSLH